MLRGQSESRQQTEEQRAVTASQRPVVHSLFALQASPKDLLALVGTLPMQAVTIVSLVSAEREVLTQRILLPSTVPQSSAELQQGATNVVAPG